MYQQNNFNQRQNQNTWQPDGRWQNQNWRERDCRGQNHVHEILGSTKTAENCKDCHSHRFCTVSGEAIPTSQGDHVHEVKFRTDFSDGHYHEFCGKSSGAIPVGGGKHVHFAKACTDEADGHKHDFQAASLINAPTD